MNHDDFFLDRSGHERLEIQGPDRAKFLHNLTTNDVKRLGVGRGQESFITSPQGKTLAYLTVLATEDRLLLRTVKNGFDVSLPHLQKYGIFDDVSLGLISAETFEFHLGGPVVEARLQELGATLGETGELNHVEIVINSIPVRLIRESPLGSPGWTLIGLIADAPKILELLNGEISRLSEPEAERRRIIAGVPEFGKDVTSNNLPQEASRDAQAINFVKGCYLGQETVARLDALGHVNKILRGFILSGRGEPSGGYLLHHEGKKVGTLTSVASSEGEGPTVALGYVKTTLADSEFVFDVLDEKGETTALTAVVSQLPMQIETVLKPSEK